MRRCFLLLVLLATVSCVKEGLDDLRPVSETFTLSLTASAPESSVDTKTQISDDLSVVWNSDDQIKVCFPVNFDLYNNTGKDVSGVSDVFASSSEDMASSAVFSCNTWGVNLNEEANGLRKYNSVGYAFYPSSVNFSHSVANYNNAKNNSARASYVIPSEQNAVEGSFDKNLNPAYAVVDRDEILAGTTDAQFHNLAALVRINLGENIDNVREIRINTANNSASTVCGTLNFTLSKDNDQPGITTTLQNTSDATPIILKRQDGENLQAGSTYYAVIAPGRTHVGLKLTFVDENDAQVEKTVTFDEYWTVKASDCWTINVKNPIVFSEPTTLEIDADSFDASYTADSKTFNVTANFDWTVNITSFNTSWLKVTPVSGSGNGSFTITTEENPDLLNSRSAQVTVTSKEKSVIVDVVQDCKRYYVVEQVVKAEDMKDGGLYVMEFVDNPSYYLHFASSSRLERKSVVAKSEGFTSDYVYELEVMDGYSVDSPYGSYPSAFMGALKSAYSERYLNIFSAAFDDESANNPIAFCSDSNSVFVLYYQWGGYYMSYYDGDACYWSSSLYGPYQWYIYEVEVQ